MSPTASLPSGRGGRRHGVPTFLIVDESPTIRTLTTEILQKLGHSESSVTLAGSPADALEAFDRVRPAVVFAELDFDGADGLAAALEMLARDPHVKLVIFTAEGRDAPRVRRAVRAGAFAVVEKPLRHDKLRAVMADLQMEEGGIERLR